MNHVLIETIAFPQILAQAAPSGGGIMQFLPMVILFAGMWFLIIAPQRKKQKEHDKMVAELKAGVKVMTNGGIYGSVTKVEKDRFIVKIAENTKVEVAKHAISSVVTKENKES